MSGWHSASWSRGKEPLAGGLGRPILTPVPGAPKVDILGIRKLCGVEGCVVEDVDVLVSRSLTLDGSS